MKPDCLLWISNLPWFGKWIIASSAVSVFVLIIDWLILPCLISNFLLVLMMFVITGVSGWATSYYLRQLETSKQPWKSEICIDWLEQLSRVWDKFQANADLANVQHPKRSTPQSLNHEVDLYTELIVQNYIKLWYSQVSSDDEFIWEIRLAIRSTILAFIAEIKKINPTAFGQKLCGLYIAHYQEYVRTIKRVARQKRILKLQDVGCCIEVDELFSYKHPVSRNCVDEVTHWEHLSFELLKLCAPNELLSDTLLCNLVTTILAKNVFQLAAEQVSDPQLLNLIFATDEGTTLEPCEALEGRCSPKVEQNHVAAAVSSISDPQNTERSVVVSSEQKPKPPRSLFLNFSSFGPFGGSAPSIADVHTSMRSSPSYGLISSVLGSIITATAGPIIPDNTTFHFRPLNKMWRSPSAETFTDWSTGKTKNNTVTKIIHGLSSGDLSSKDCTLKTSPEDEPRRRASMLEGFWKDSGVVADLKQSGNKAISEPPSNFISYVDLDLLDIALRKPDCDTLSVASSVVASNGVAESYSPSTATIESSRSASPAMSASVSLYSRDEDHLETGVEAYSNDDGARETSPSMVLLNGEYDVEKTIVPDVNPGSECRPDIEVSSSSTLVPNGQNGDISPKYEEIEDFATTIAKLRQLLEQRDSQSSFASQSSQESARSPISQQSTDSAGSNVCKFSYSSSRNSNGLSTTDQVVAPSRKSNAPSRTSSGESDVIEASEIPLDGSIFLNLVIPSTELQTDNKGSQFALYVIQYDGIYLDPEPGSDTDSANDNNDCEAKLILHRTTVRRRFREFLALQSRLEDSSKYKAVLKGMKTPSKWLTLPFSKLDKAAIETRRRYLEIYLQKLSRNVLIGNSDELRLFLAYGIDSSLSFVQKPLLQLPVPRLDKLLAKTVSGMYNTIITALPTFDGEHSASHSPHNCATPLFVPSQPTSPSHEKKRGSNHGLPYFDPISPNRVVTNQLQLGCESQKKSLSAALLNLAGLDTPDHPRHALKYQFISQERQNPLILNLEYILPMLYERKLEAKECPITQSNRLMNLHRRYNEISDWRQMSVTKERESVSEICREWLLEPEAPHRKESQDSSLDDDPENRLENLIPLSSPIISVANEILSPMDVWVNHQPVINATTLIFGQMIQVLIQDLLEEYVTERTCVEVMELLRLALWPTDGRENGSPKPEVNTSQIVDSIMALFPGISKSLIGGDELHGAISLFVSSFQMKRLNFDLLLLAVDLLLDELQTQK